MTSVWVGAPQNVTNFLNLEDRSFENVSIVTFESTFDIPLLNKLFMSSLNLFISLIELKYYLITYIFLILSYLWI